MEVWGARAVSLEVARMETEECLYAAWYAHYMDERVKERRETYSALGAVHSVARGDDHDRGGVAAMWIDSGETRLHETRDSFAQGSGFCVARLVSRKRPHGDGRGTLDARSSPAKRHQDGARYARPHSPTRITCTKA